MANIFVNDPLLGAQGNVTSYEQQLAYISEMQRQLEERKAALQQLPQQQAAPQGQSPIWDEIERLVEDLSDTEKSYIFENEDFKESQDNVLLILQREYMNIMRPIVERTKDGKEALQAHLALTKRLKKSAAKASEQNMELFHEYTEKYSEMTFADFMKMKREKKGGKR